MRRSGSAAPHSNWSPTVNADRYSPPIDELAQPSDRNVHAAGHRGRRQLAHRALALVRHDAHPLVGRGDDAGDLVERHVLPQLDRQRLAVAAHRADAHAQAVDRRRRRCRRLSPRPSILLVSAPPFHSSSDMPLPMSLSIQGIRLPASGTPPKFSIGSVPSVCLASTLRSISRIAEPGSASSCSHLGVDQAELRQQLAHVLRAAARGRLVGHAGHPLDEIVLRRARACPSACSSRCSCRRCSS